MVRLHFFTYHFCFPVEFIADSACPHFKITIENKCYHVLFDLGAKTPLTLNKKILEQINKTPDGTTSYGDIKGTRYEVLVYRIPEICIDNQIFRNVQTKEESIDFIKNSTAGSSEKQEMAHDDDGRIGRDLFSGKNLFFDFHNSTFIVTNDISRLKKVGYSLDKFTQVRFERTPKGYNLEIKIDDVGIKKFAIDTGASHSILCSSSVATIPNTQKCGFPMLQTSRFIIGSKDFGNQELLILEFPTHCTDIDGILGMDFLKEHVIYLDFTKMIAYIGNPVK